MGWSCATSLNTSPKRIVLHWTVHVLLWCLSTRGIRQRFHTHRITVSESTDCKLKTDGDTHALCVSFGLNESTGAYTEPCKNVTSVPKLQYATLFPAKSGCFVELKSLLFAERTTTTHRPLSLSPLACLPFGLFATYTLVAGTQETGGEMPPPQKAFL